MSSDQMRRILRQLTLGKLTFTLFDQIMYANNEKLFQQSFLWGTKMYFLVKVLFLICVPLKTLWRNG